MSLGFIGVEIHSRHFMGSEPAALIFSTSTHSPCTVAPEHPSFAAIIIKEDASRSHDEAHFAKQAVLMAPSQNLTPQRHRPLRWLLWRLFSPRSTLLRLYNCAILQWIGLQFPLVKFLDQLKKAMCQQCAVDAQNWPQLSSLSQGQQHESRDGD